MQEELEAMFMNGDCAAEVLDALFAAVKDKLDGDGVKEFTLHMRGVVEEAMDNAEEYGWDGI